MCIMFESYPETWPTRRSWDRKYRYFGEKRRDPKVRYKRGRNFISVPKFVWNYQIRSITYVSNKSSEDT